MSPEAPPAQPGAAKTGPGWGFSPPTAPEHVPAAERGRFGKGLTDCGHGIWPFGPHGRDWAQALTAAAHRGDRCVWRRVRIVKPKATWNWMSRAVPPTIPTRMVCPGEVTLRSSPGAP